MVTIFFFWGGGGREAGHFWGGELLPLKYPRQNPERPIGHLICYWITPGIDAGKRTADWSLNGLFINRFHPEYQTKKVTK